LHRIFTPAAEADLGLGSGVLRPKGHLVYADIVFPRLMARLAKSFKHNYGVPTSHDLNLFIEGNKFSIIHAPLSKALIWNWSEAVYQRN
jgi:hypothetical protein